MILARLLLIVAMLSLAACVSPPVQEMSNARQAIAAAVEAGAAEEGEVASAQRLLRSAEKFLQNKKFREARRAAVAAKLKAFEALEAVRPPPDE